MRSTVVLLLPAIAISLAMPAAASEFGDRYPAGSIRDRAQAEQALRDAEVEATRIERDAAARETECHKGLLVNRCREQVRRDRLGAERELRRVRVEANDLHRRLDAEEAAQRRARAAEPADRPAPGGPREPPKNRAIPPDEAARNRAAYDKRLEDQRKEAAAEQARAAERAENARRYQEKQAEAERRAQEKAAERKKNEERRAERRRETEAREAQREEVRRRAEEAPKAVRP